MLPKYECLNFPWETTGFIYSSYFDKSLWMFCRYPSDQLSVDLGARTICPVIALYPAKLVERWAKFELLLLRTLVSIGCKVHTVRSTGESIGERGGLGARKERRKWCHARLPWPERLWDVQEVWLWQTADWFALTNKWINEATSAFLQVLLWKVRTFLCEIKVWC